MSIPELEHSSSSGNSAVPGILVCTSRSTCGLAAFSGVRCGYSSLLAYEAPGGKEDAFKDDHPVPTYRRSILRHATNRFVATLAQRDGSH